MTERIEKIKIDALITFENHPFKERTGEEQAELVESIGNCPPAFKGQI